MFGSGETLQESFGEHFAGWVDGLTVTADPDQIASGYALRDHLTAILTGSIGRLDSESGHVADGAVTAAAWLRYRVHLDSAEAARTVRIARRLRDWPRTEAAWTAGQLTVGQVAVIVDTAGATDALAAIYAAQEPEVLRTISGYHVRHVKILMGHWVRQAQQEFDDPEPAAVPQAVRLSSHLDGQWRLDGDLNPETGNLINTALDVAIGDLPDPETDLDSEGAGHVLLSERRAEALAHIARFYLDHRDSSKAPRNRPHVTVIVDLPYMLGQAGRAETIDGLVLDRVAVGQLLCDANMHRMITDGPSVILDHGRATRTCTAEQWNVLVARDRHCAWPAGCDVPANRCQAHHEPGWIDGGTTDIAKMRLLCNGHHRLRHQPGWTAKILPDSTYEITSPTGRTFTSRPRC